MAGRVSLDSLRSVLSDVEVFRSRGRYRCPVSEIRGLSSREADVLALRTHLQTAHFCPVPWRARRACVFRVLAAKQGFGAQPKKKTKKADRTPQKKEIKDPIARARQILSNEEQTPKAEDVLNKSTTGSDEAPGLIINDAQNYNVDDEELFNRRLAEIKKAAQEQKILAEQKKYGPIDYDAALSPSSNSWTSNLPAKIGIGVAVAVFGLIFALGDFLPSQSPNAEKSSLVDKVQLTKEESSKLQAQVREFEDVLKTSPEDRNALEGAGVSYAELGEFDKAVPYLTKVVQKSPGDVEALRLLAEVQNGKGDYDSSASSYRAAIRASGKSQSLTLLRGLVDTLLTSRKPSEAVGELLAARARLNYDLEQVKADAKQAILPPNRQGTSKPPEPKRDLNAVSDPDERVDPVTLELLLGKAYAAWDGHTGDAATVYDGLMKNFPEDYRGFLAKGVLLKTQNKLGDAERMFIQARYLAPAKSKSLVDVYSGRRPS